MPIDRDSATRLSGYYVAISDNEGWSLYGAPWLQPVAISGKSERRGSRGNKPEPLPWVATSCLRCSMVRRGSTVRVRQRVCKSAANRRLVLSAPLARSPPCVRYGALYGAFRFRSPGPRRRKPSRLRGLGTTAGRGSSRHASRCRDTAGRCESAAAATAGRLVSAESTSAAGGAYGARPQAARADPARRPSARPGLGHNRGPGPAPCGPVMLTRRYRTRAAE
jgi:hypothetical protein